ncbi:MAG TPA: 16S rRNA (uracil(1498)-N(3))-methyltransferase [Caulobacteraceae bacterium]|nr:16S rRNA (uracil(1498)-N(3))-methyltransferase [Caulobacteraceae bacterium]
MIRLFVEAGLYPDAGVALARDQAHYLVNVMRLAAGDALLLFNGRDGEWRASVAEASRKGCRLTVDAKVRDQAAPPDLDLIVALVKRARLETIVEKAAELGARRVRLAITERTNAERTNVERLHAIAVEAAEQTGRLDVPEVLAPEKLPRLLESLGEGRRLMFCDEAGDAAPAAQALSGLAAGPWAVLIGPEGGFSPAERARIRALPDAVPVSLGPRILRADTAAISALTLWQSALGDWRA